ncbi:TRAP transporter substrate-binding protein DctP [Salinispirillum sp. LH 10-3-1]|uniref:TRAP transporter substrate-binding protein DctP n=1 Tax=Salinispirillum sp. LH 10-3-1 TaxID=2952525 RepID=A0AB38YCM1_9GAMM
MVRALFFVLLVWPVIATANTTLKISTAYPAGTFAVEQLRLAGEDILKGTEGRVRLQIYPGGVMGDDQAVQRRIRIGQLDGMVAQSGAISNLHGDLQLYSLPFLFDSPADVDRLREQWDSKLLDRLNSLGWQGYGPIDGGFAYIMSQDPIQNKQDLNSARLWVPANSTAPLFAQALGVRPIALPIGEVLTSLTTGGIDSIVSPVPAALTLQWFSRVDYLVNQPVIYTYALVLLSERSFRGISDADRDVIDAALSRYAADMDNRSRRDNAAALNAIEQQNVRILPSNESIRESFLASRADVYRLLRDQGALSNDGLDAAIDFISAM